MSTLPLMSDALDPTRWREVKGFDFVDITYHRGIPCGPEADGRSEGVGMPAVRIAFDHPDIRSAFCPGTADELYRALGHARRNSSAAVVTLTGSSPSMRSGEYSFCSDGNQRVRGRDGYRYEIEDADPEATTVQHREQIDPARAGHLHIPGVQRPIRTMPKVVTVAILGWAAGGGYFPSVVADLLIASIEHAAFMQTDVSVGPFGAGYGLVLLACQARGKRVCETSSLAERYDAETAECQGIIDRVVPHTELEETALGWTAIIATKSPQVIRMPKFVFDLADDGLAGQQVSVGEVTRMAYMAAEAQEGRGAFLEHHALRWEDYPYYC